MCVFCGTLVLLRGGGGGMGRWGGGGELVGGDVVGM